MQKNFVKIENSNQGNLQPNVDGNNKSKRNIIEFVVPRRPLKDGPYDSLDQKKTNKSIFDINIIYCRDRPTVAKTQFSIESSMLNVWQTKISILKMIC